MKSGPSTVNEYLATLTPEQRSALQRLRRQIRAAAPKAVECISYGIPAYRMHGRMIVAFGAASKHCAFYPGAHPVRVHAKELKKYSTSKGTVRFTTDQPLPDALVRKLVKTRVAQYAAEAKQPTAKPRKRPRKSTEHPR